MPDPRFAHCPECAGGRVNCPRCDGEGIVEERRGVLPASVWEAAADPDLSPGVFWFLGSDGLPVGIGCYLTGGPA